MLFVVRHKPGDHRVEFLLLVQSHHGKGSDRRDGAQLRLRVQGLEIKSRRGWYRRGLQTLEQCSRGGGCASTLLHAFATREHGYSTLNRYFDGGRPVLPQLAFEAAHLQGEDG
jgi:hypothetical protein